MDSAVNLFSRNHRQTSSTHSECPEWICGRARSNRHVQLSIVSILMLAETVCCNNNFWPKTCLNVFYVLIGEKSNGPSTLPCGTPDVQLAGGERSVPMAMDCVRPVMKEQSQPSALPLILKSVRRRSTRMSWSVESNAAEMSSDSRTVVCRSHADVTTSLTTLQQRSFSWISKVVRRLTLAGPSCQHHMWLQVMHRQLLEYLGHHAQVGDRPVVRHVKLVKSWLLQQRCDATLFKWWWEHTRTERHVGESW